MKTVEEAVARVGDLKDGQMKQVQVGGTDVLLVRLDGQFYALGAECPHNGAPLATGTLCHGRVICPWHAAIFDATSGDLLEPPSLDALAQFSVRVEDDQVYVTVPEQPADGRTMPMCSHEPEADSRLFAIVGSGAAGGSAAEALRQSDFRGRIVMISPEPVWPYDRTNCSKAYLAGDVSDEGMVLRDEEFYRQHGIERIQGRVQRLDVDERTIALDNGEAISADAILVATGGVPRTMDVSGARLMGVLTLRGWADSQAIREAAQEADKAVVVGAGFIGMEVAASLTGHDVEVTVVAPESVPLEKHLGREVGDVVRKLHEENGTAFRLGRKVQRFDGGDKVQTVELDDGEQLPADLVVVGLGIIPPAQFLQGVPINDDGSVNVDEHLRLAENVYAAGDVACYPDPFGSRRIRIEHWRLAQQHGRIAGQAMAGKDVSFESVPFFWTRQFGVSLMYAGHAEQWDEVLMTGEPAKRDFTAFYVKDNRLLAAAGTQDGQIAAFMERMRMGQLPMAEEIRDQSSVDLLEGL
jgi:NADPH-dependent 2,4-dienoyl-CoA reductase/sulfur reductase-like enzyme/nitrite reductase/ring-hydroxylating ferredoxin subunit